MRKNLAAGILIIFFTGLHYIGIAQQPVNARKKSSITTPVPDNALNSQTMGDSNTNQDSLIKARLVELAINNNNPTIKTADDNIKIAKINLIKAKNSWLNSLNLSSNINEFVINNTKVDSVPVASYYPKYNFGVIIPFDIFSKTKNDKKIAMQNIDIAKAAKEDRSRIIKKEVLTLYENYKEMKELLRLQKISVEEDNQAYITAQKSYTDGTIQLDEMNRSYQTYINAQSILITSQRNYNVAIVEMEEEIGIPLDDALNQALNSGQDKKE